MKKIIVFICVMAVAITINSCKHIMWYACCDTGHPHWEGKKEDNKDYAVIDRDEHDKITHGSVLTAGVCHN